ncbi:zymogen granule membrane protein 16-like [Acanthochromis polyacanthus]|uniref:zymogen granule membrane protein 16-like n=1 Tax=Acanthochromis polyacanthus TaxID=80966 RepID=UPI002234C25A|nr:zymogen granule membrane protein 16-like [Acanthochromis polyacanthus]
MIKAAVMRDGRAGRSGREDAHYLRLRLLCCVVFSLLAASVLADGFQYSYSRFRGSKHGVETTLRGTGRITAVRLWSGYNSFIFGFESFFCSSSRIQFRFGPIWSRTVGRTTGARQEIQLFEDETIVQVSGKYGRYIQQLIFVTSRGRFLIAGRPSFQSFNMFPEHKDAELIFLSIRFGRALYAVASHWAVVNQTAW